MEQLIPSAVFGLLVLALCLLRPDAGRDFLGIFFLVMALGGIVFLIEITPLGVWTLANPIMALALALLLVKEHDRSFLEMLRSLQGGGSMRDFRNERFGGE